MVMDIDQNLVELQQTIYQSQNPTRRWLHTLRKDWIIDKINQYRGGGQQCCTGSWAWRRYLYTFSSGGSWQHNDFRLRNCISESYFKNMEI